MNYNEVRVVIGTKNRVNKQITLKYLWQIREHIEIICHPDDYDGLSELYQNDVKSISVYPIELDNDLGKQRQWIVENTEQPYLLLLDDNLQFHTRSKSVLAEDTKFPLKGLIAKHFPPEKIKEEIDNMINILYEHAKKEDVALAGLSNRSGNQNVAESFKENTRIFGASLVDLSVMRNLGIRYDAVNLKQDFYINLSFLTNGYKNICIYDYAFEKPQANMAGGCSSYRTLEKSNEGAIILKNLFPNFISIREKSVKSWGENFSESGFAYDVIVHWKKAYEIGKSKKIVAEEW